MDEKKQITFKYLFDKNYNPKYANGLYGGLYGSDIVINFYIERHGLPISETHAIDNTNNEVGKKLSHEPHDLTSSAVRFVEHGVIMNLTTAKMFHQWLGDKLSEAEALKKAKK